MPVQDRPISEFPRALEVLSTALVLISNPSGVDTYDSNSCSLTELGKTILDVEYTQELGQMSVFEAILNVRVLSGTTDPTSAVGVDNQLYVKYQTIGGVDSVVAVYVKLDGDWVEIQTGGGGASVTLGTTVPSDSTGSDGDLYVQYEALTYKVVEYFVKINGSWRKAPYSRVVALTQAEYDLITPDTTTLYIITDAQSSYQTKTDANLDTTATTVVGAINELNTGKQDTIKYITGSVTLEANSYVSPFTYYKEVNLTSSLDNKTIIGIVGKTTTTNPITFNYNTSGYLRIYGSKAEVVEFRVSYI